MEDPKISEGGEKARQADAPIFKPNSQESDKLEVSFLEPSEKNVNVLKKLNAHIFPVNYHEKFYSDCMAAIPLTAMALYSDFVVGGICCRLEKLSSGKSNLYIMTLGVFAPYRRRGVGAQLLANTMSLAKNDPVIENVYLHVQVNNDEAIEFYKHFGFEYKETLKNYYKRIDPPDCYVYARSVNDWDGPTKGT